MIARLIAASARNLMLVVIGTVFAVAAGIRGPIGAFLQCAPMVYLGRISYGIYVIHNFAKPLMDATLTALNQSDWMAWLHRSPWVCIPVFISLVDGFDKRLRGYQPIPIGGLMGYSFADYLWLDS